MSAGDHDDGIDALFDAKQTEKLAGFESLDTAIWVGIVEDSQVIWANRRGLEQWRASSLAELRGRDWENNTPAVKAAVKRACEQFRQHGHWEARWTIHPNGHATTIDQSAREEWTLADGQTALVVEARTVDPEGPDEDVRRRAEILRYAPTPIAMLSASGEVAGCNPAFMEEFGGEEALAESILSEERALLLSAIHDNRRVEFERDLIRDGEVRSYRIRSDPAVDPVTSERCAVVALTDTTSMVRQKRALQTALEELEERRQALERSNQDLESFAYVASHDLKAPVRTAAGFAEILRDDCGDALGDDGREYVDRILRGTKRMDRLLTDLLQFSRADRDITRNDVDLAEVVREAAALHGLDGETVQYAELPQLRGDFAALVRVFSNLLGNAIKFRREPAPRIEIEARCCPEGWQVSVRDNGLGFAPEHAERIFAPFKRLHGVSAYEGSGLGLSIVQRTVEAHGGSVTATGELGVGATFIITLPAD